MRKAVTLLLALLFGIFFFWAVVLKIIYRLAARRGDTLPCPASFAWLVDNPLRRWYLRPVMNWLEIQPGETVLEIGPGPGVFSAEAARRAGDSGRLIAVDIQPEMIARLEARLGAAGVTNVETHTASAYELPLPEASVDRAFLVTVLNEIPDRSRALREIHRVLKPGGVLSISEEFMDPDYPFAFETIRRAEAAGFRLIRKHGSFFLYTLNFEK